MIELPTPCGDVIYYPANLAILATQGKPSVFQTMSHKSGKAYLVLVKLDAPAFQLTGNMSEIAMAYMAIPWREVDIADGSGLFSYKLAPSSQEATEYFACLQ